MSPGNGEVLSLETIPKELLLVICDYLNAKDLKHLGLSSKSFNDVISQNVSTLKKLRLQLDSDSNLTQGKNELTRSYTSVSFSYIKFNKTIGLWLTSNFCSFLRVLKIMNMDFSMADKKLFRKTFQSLHHLESLVMSECDIDDFENSMQASIDPIEIKTLKTLDFLATHLAFLLFIRTPNLTSLKIANKSDLESPAIITTFLAEQPLEKLENLALWMIDFEDFEEISKEQLAKIKIPLRNLSMHYITAPFQTEANFLSFLSLFTENLTELDLRKLKPEPPQNIYELLFTKFHKVKTLRIALGYAPDDADFYSKLPNNPAVTKLIVIEEKNIQRTKALYGILTKLPNLETLVIKAEIKNREILQFIATNCTNIKTLAVNRICSPEQTLKGFKMPNLESLTVCSMRDMTVGGWKDLIRAFKNLQSFSIHKSDERTLNDKTFNIFTKSLSSLKHLMFGEGFKAIKRVFNQMKNNCKHLQTVEILRSAFDDDPSLYNRVVGDFKKPGLRFICYEDVHNVCEKFDQCFGTNFWKTSHSVDSDEEDYDISDYTDSDEDDEDGSDYFDSDEDEIDNRGLQILMQMLGNPGIPMVDSDGEEEMGRFNSDGEWEPWDAADYYLD